MIFGFLLESVIFYLSIPFIVYLLYIQISKKKYKLPPGPKGWPFIGNIPDPHNTPLHFKELLTKWKDKYGYVVLFKRFGINFVYVSDYKPAFKALTQTFSAELSGRPTNSVANLSVGNINAISVTSTDPAWIETRKQLIVILRKVAEPQNMTNISGRAYDLFATQIREQKELLESEEFPVMGLSYWFAHNIIALVLWQETIEYHDRDYQDSAITFEKLMAAYSNLYSFDTTQLNNLPHPDKRKMIKYNKQLVDRIQNQMNRRRENDHYRSDPTCLIDYLMLIQDQQKEKDERLLNLPKLDDWLLANITFDLYIGGFEAFGIGILWTIGQLASHPHTQEKIRNELRDMATTTGQSFNAKWMDELHYLKAFIHEVLRTATFSPFSLLHRALSDTKIGDFDIPKDTIVSVNIHGIHHDPRYWKNPYDFIPERFLNDEGRFQLPKEGFMPFGVGRRTCIAERYTVKESQFVFTGRMCQDFQIVWSSKNKAGKIEEELTNIHALYPKPFYVEFIPLS